MTEHRGTAEAADGLPVPQRYWAAIGIWLAISVAVLNGAMVNVALPTISAEMGVSAAVSTWAVTSYQVAVVMLLLPVAMLGEIVGYRRVFIGGVMLGAAAAVASALSHGLAGLAVARFLQGLGDAATMGINGALLRFTYPRSEIGRGIGYNALVVAVMAAAGPAIAAAILAVASWRWLFAIHVPFALLALLIGWRFLPRVPPGGHRFDFLSAACNAIAFGGLFLFLSDVVHGTLGVRAGAELVLGAGAAVILVQRSRGRARPMIPLDLLGVPLLRLSYVTSSCSFAALFTITISMPFVLQQRFGFSHVETGMFLTALSLGTAVGAPLAARLADRHSPALLCAVGLGLMAIGMLVLLLAPGAASPFYLAPPMALAGFGFGMFQTPNNRVMLTVAPPHRAGAAAGMLAIARLVGQTGGVLIVTLLFQTAGPASGVPLMVGLVLAVIAATASLRRTRHIGEAH
jgi:DHA2 family multidrug resistance protein-like MFS transporter